MVLGCFALVPVGAGAAEEEVGDASGAETAEAAEEEEETEDKARRVFSFRGGYFEPWKGESGVAFAAGYGWSLGARSYVDFELEIRSFEGELFDLDKIDITAANFNAIYRFVFPTSSAFTPYAGVGVALALNFFDAKKVERGLENRYDAKVKVSGVGAGAGVLGLLGVEYDIPGVERLSVFAEARFDYSAQLSAVKTDDDDIDELEVENLGGISAQGGLRYAF